MASSSSRSSGSANGLHHKKNSSNRQVRIDESQPMDDDMANDGVISHEFLKCPVCEMDFNNPKVLPCLHSFCADCLKASLKQSNIGPGQEFLCPLCHQKCMVPSRGVNAIKTNIFFVTLQEFLDRREVATDQGCDGCDSGARARRKCVECNDWLCSQCCSMHKKVRLTRDHRLVSTADLQAGKCDQLLKDSFEPLMCSKHNEPLLLYCTEPVCQAPICTVCKTTLGHDGHVAIQLDEQAVTEAHSIQALQGALQRSIQATTTKMNNLRQEEKITSQARKKIHKAINARMEELTETVVKQIAEYGESLHQEVETMVKTHKKEVNEQMDACKFNLQAQVTTQLFSKALLDFGRAEELVSMAKEVKHRLSDFQRPPDTNPPGWRQPRLYPPAILNEEQMTSMFGKLTFEGEIVKTLMLKSFSAHIDGDNKVCALCDVSFTDDGQIAVVDRDNRKVKVFDKHGKLTLAVGEKSLKAPNRIVVLRDTQGLLIKDDKALKLISRDGQYVQSFAPTLKQPVGLGQTRDGEVIVTDWMTGAVHCYDEEGLLIRDFLHACESPGYVTGASNGDIILSDWKQHVVKIFANDGRLKHVCGEHGKGDGQLDHPYGVCTDRFGHIIVADTWNNRVQMLSEDGQFLSVLVSKSDGLQWPQGVAVTQDGRLIVVEQHGNIKVYQYMA